jgi:hypothetical protein
MNWFTRLTLSALDPFWWENADKHLSSVLHIEFPTTIKYGTLESGDEPALVVGMHSRVNQPYGYTPLDHTFNFYDGATFFTFHASRSNRLYECVAVVTYDDRRNGIAGKPPTRETGTLRGVQSFIARSADTNGMWTAEHGRDGMVGSNDFFGDSANPFNIMRFMKNAIINDLGGGSDDDDDDTDPEPDFDPANSPSKSMPLVGV